MNKPLSDEARKVAQETVNYLFSNEAGDKADELRLYQVYSDGSGLYLGGWGRQPVIDALATIIDTALEERREADVKAVESIELSSLDAVEAIRAAVTAIRKGEEK